MQCCATLPRGAPGNRRAGQICRTRYSLPSDSSPTAPACVAAQGVRSSSCVLFCAAGVRGCRSLHAIVCTSNARLRQRLEYFDIPFTMPAAKTASVKEEAPKVLLYETQVRGA